MNKIDKIIKQAEGECKCIWLSAERIDSQLSDIRHALANLRGHLASRPDRFARIVKLKALENTLINKTPGWQ